MPGSCPWPVTPEGRGLPFQVDAGKLTVADPRFPTGCFRRARRTAAAGQQRTIGGSKNQPNQSPLSSQLADVRVMHAGCPRTSAKRAERISAPVREFAFTVLAQSYEDSRIHRPRHLARQEPAIARWLMPSPVTTSAPHRSRSLPISATASSTAPSSMTPTGCCFRWFAHGDEVCALMLEVIANHDYDKSRFLRGAAIDESKIPDIDADDAIGDAQPLRYLHPEHTDDSSARQADLLRRHAGGRLSPAAAAHRGRQRRQRQDRTDPGKAQTCRRRGALRHALHATWRTVPAIFTTPTVSSTAGRKPCSSPTASSSNPSTSRRAGKPVGATLPAGLRACGRASRSSTAIRSSKKFAA